MNDNSLTHVKQILTITFKRVLKTFDPEILKIFNKKECSYCDVLLSLKKIAVLLPLAYEGHASYKHLDKNRIIFVFCRTVGLKLDIWHHRISTA